MSDVMTLFSGVSSVVLDSPHSGTEYPVDFDHACDRNVLRQAEDTYVDWLYAFAKDMGVSLLCARFPRSYLDANRGLNEIDSELFDSPWPHDTVKSEKVRLGKGLVWRLTDDGVPIYDRKLTHDEVSRRIARCWHPYHAALANAIDAAHSMHGRCTHINCHSMPSVAGSHATSYPGMVHPDIVIGDRDGSTARPGLAIWVARFFSERGYSVSVNNPYKGVELVRRYSDPRAGRNSLQLEINRKLYMDERTLALEPGHVQLQRDLRDLVFQLETAPSEGIPMTHRKPTPLLPRGREL
ncbi:N-formylglutamate amidohydrolase [Piscinibacter sp.]|uniref:N-formylglutamate amidohydrolase n=1 Tax=Piscinibacter sp. TaxID=1903157 RepID=UPI002F4190F6